MSLDYRQCYIVLRLQPGCTWAEARERYRQLAKQWHPDHFQTDEERHAAEEKIKAINSAFHSVAQYYRRHHALPLDIADLDRPSTAPAAAAPPTQAAAETAAPPSPTTAPKAKHRIPVRYVAVLALTAAALVGWYQMPATDLETVAILSPPPPGPARAPVSKPVENYFTIGSTLGEVNAVQGIPTRVTENIWYYGDATVRFREGVVDDWQDNPNSPPLKARLDVQAKSRAHDFHVGSTKADVLAAQGKPMHMTDNVWDYGVSRVYFRGDYVSSWDSSPLNPLKVR